MDAGRRQTARPGVRTRTRGVCRAFRQLPWHRPRPFDDVSFDCVVPPHVFGHIPAAAEDGVTREIARALKPGGRSLHVIESDSNHPLIELAKQYPELDQYHLIEPDGHVGLEIPDQTLDRFRESGPQVVQVRGQLHSRLVVKWFDNELRQFSLELDRQFHWAERTLPSAARLAAAEVRLGMQDRLSRGPLRLCPFIAVVLKRSPSRLCYPSEA